jgi:SAM-dependent methyltransferase
MKVKTLERLNRINNEFYQKYANSFAQTRRKVQPGVSRILSKNAKSGNWLDIGCGNGILGRAWAQREFTGLYFGVDFSSGLIAEAKKNVQPCRDEHKIVFHQTDLNSDEWTSSLPDVEWNAIFCFAVLHHIPGGARRRLLCTQLRGLLAAGRDCFVSVWQPRNSPRLIKRMQPWESVGIEPSNVDSGDVLMDWRGHHADSSQEQALRFVHIFSEDELTELAYASGFSVIDNFYSDGKEGNLGLYQHWRSISYENTIFNV